MGALAYSDQKPILRGQFGHQQPSSYRQGKWSKARPQKSLFQYSLQSVLHNSEKGELALSEVPKEANAGNLRKRLRDSHLSASLRYARLIVVSSAASGTPSVRHGFRLHTVLCA